MIMSINLFSNLFNITGMHAVFVMLVDSLWIGALAALLAGIIITLTKKHGPQLRYQLLTGLLALFVLSMAFAFYTAFINETHAGADGNKTIVVTATSTTIRISAEQLKQKNIFDTSISFIQANAGIIVAIWLMVIIFRCLQLVSGLHSLQRLKRRWIMEVSDHWNQKLHELAAKLRIKRPVEFLQSSLAKVPMVIGHLKPVLLFPIGLLNTLPADEVEAILLHELAHIKRNDFLVNLLQQIAEIFFFFNPAVIWISSLIKNERENCCDDMALSITRDKKIFIHALVAFQEYNTSVTYATTFAGSKNHLLNRVKRIITNNNKTLNTMEKLVLASGIIITCLATLAFNPGKEKDTINAAKRNAVSEQITAPNNTTEAQSNKSKPAEIYSGYTDTIPKKKSGPDGDNINFKGDIDGQRVELKEENSEIKELYIDGKKIPEDEYAQYQPMIEKIHAQMKEQSIKLKLQVDKLDLQKQRLQEQAEAMEIDSKKMKEQTEMASADMARQTELMEQQKVQMQKQAERMQKNDSSMRIQSQKMQQDFMQKQEEFKKKQIELQEKMKELKLQQEKMELIQKDTLKTTSSIYTKPVIIVKPSITVKPTVSLTSTVNEEPVAIAGTATIVYSKASVISPVSVNSTVSIQPVKITTVSSTLPMTHTISLFRNSTAEDIINDLEEANVISSRSNVSVELTNEALIVNGVKQPEKIHQEILKKRIRKPGDKITLRSSNREQ